MWAKKKIVVEIDEKYVDQKKHQMVTYIIGKAYRKKLLIRNIKKKMSDVDRQKKRLFFLESKKKKFASNKKSPPPPRYLMVRPLNTLYSPMAMSELGFNDTI